MSELADKPNLTAKERAAAWPWIAALHDAEDRREWLGLSRWPETLSGRFQHQAFEQNTQPTNSMRYNKPVAGTFRMPPPVDAWRRPPARLGIRLHTIGRSDDGSTDLTTGERRRHMCIAEKTGTGKSTLLPNPMADDLESGRGFALIDRHGDFPGVARRRTGASNLHAWVKFARGNNPTEAIPIKTLPVAPSTAHPLGTVRSRTQSRYARNRREVERQTQRIFS